MTVATVLWNMMLNPNNGIFNSILSALGAQKQCFFTDAHQALWCIVVVSSWIGVGYWMMFILAGLKNIDSSIYEAAEIDGAGWLQRTLRVTLPMYEAYRSAFSYADRPRSSAIVTILLFIIGLICLLQFRLLNSGEEREVSSRL